MMALTGILSLLNIILLTAGIYTLISRLCSGPGAPLKLFTAWFCTVIAISDIYYLMLVSKAGFTVLLIVITLINLAHLKWSSKAIISLWQAKSKTYNIKATILLLSTVLLITTLFLLNGNKYGGFDAIYIWNSHAVYLYHDATWQHMFADNQELSHMDYPLMLPSFVAYLWKCFNDTSFIAPLLFSFSLIVSIPLMIYYALKSSDANNIYAFAGLIILAVDLTFQSYSSAQMADMLLCVLILLSTILWTYLKPNEDSNNALFLGFICASATWAKNEGILFFLVFSVAFIIANLKNKAILKRYITGALFPLAITISFKIFFAPANDLAAGTGHGVSLLHKLTDVSRYLLIATSVIKELFKTFSVGLILAAILLILQARAYKSAPMIVLFLVLGGYLFIYLITPYDLGWHIATSLQRLLYQLYPSFIFLSLLSLSKAYPIKALTLKKN